MLNINDSGKIWLRGSVRPEYGVRVGDNYFVVGEGDSQSTIYSVYENHLFVVLHYSEKKREYFGDSRWILYLKLKGHYLMDSTRPNMLT